jgi:hypothetical protein
MLFLRKHLNPKIILLIFVFSLLPLGFIAAGSEADSFHFTVTADMRYNHEQFRKVCKAINKKMGGPGVFHVSAGDIGPLAKNRKIIDEEFGADAIWYPVAGNHDSENPSNMKWIRKEFHSLPYVVNSGPVNCEETTYSFDYKNAHFVVLNEYYDGAGDTKADGNIVPGLLSWLKNDLDKNTRPFIFIFGHEPAFIMQDEYWKRTRHYGDSLDKYPENRDEFWKLLEDKRVTAYICGHTHCYSRYQHNGGKVWQVVPVACPYPENTHKYDALLNIAVSNADVKFEVYRDLDGDGAYTIYDNWTVPAAGTLRQLEWPDCMWCNYIKRIK